MAKKSKVESIVEWEVPAPVIKNPLIWFQSVLVVGLGATFVFLLLIGANLYERHWEQIPDSLTVWFFLFLGMAVLYGIAMLLILAGGTVTRYELDDGGIAQYSLYKKRKFFKWLGLLGLFSNTSAGYTAAGSALLSGAREAIGITWDEVTHIETYPFRHEIRLKNDWRTQMQVFCPKEKYEEVLDVARVHIIEVPAAKQPMPFAHKVFLSFFSLVFGIFLFPELPIEVVPLFTLVMMLSALFALWSEGRKKGIASLITLLFATGLPTISAVINGVGMQRDGALYALIVEALLYLFFVIVGYKRIREV